MTYQWRGLSLDIARNFFGPPVLKRLIDRLNDLDLNRLHLHLTDDQGWRIEIPGRPELTRESGGTSIDGGNSGYLTVGDYASLVEYADAKGVVIVPEVDLPGHVNAALHACPGLNASGVAAQVRTDPEVGYSFLNVNLPQTEDFLNDVLVALAEMTPGQWMHIGGDECPLLSNEDFGKLVSMAAGIVAETGHQPVAWQEGALAGLGKDLVLQYWRTGDSNEPALYDALLDQINVGADVILSPASHAYFDLRYDENDTVHQDWAGTLSVEKASDWVPAEVLPIDPARILGVEAAIWTEFIHTPEDLDNMLLPRLEVFADIAHGD